MKRIFGFIILILIVSLPFSCKINNIDNKLRNCVNDRVIKSSGIIDEKFNYYNVIDRFEKLMIKNNLINDLSKESYISFIKNISSVDTLNIELLKKFIKDIQNIYFENRITAPLNEISYVCVDCPFKILIEERNQLNSSLLFQVQTGNEILDNNSFSKEIVINLIEKIDNNNDFNKIEYRAPIDLYIIKIIEDNLNKYNELK